MKITTNFIIQEFVPKIIFDTYGEKSVWFINPTMVGIAQKLRTDTGKVVTVNNWHSGGTFTLRGYRPPNTAIGARYSQHKLGNAIDINIAGMEEREVYDFIISRWDDYAAAGLTTIENPSFTPGWLHLDCRPKAAGYPVNGPLIVNP